MFCFLGRRSASRLLRQLFDNDVQCVGKVEDNVELPLLPRIACLLDAYSMQLRGGHGLVTAADCIYFTLLQYQRRIDSIEIHETAVQESRLQGVSAADADISGVPTLDWRAQLDSKKAEAISGIMERAAAYSLGTFSCASGLLQLATGSAQREDVLKRLQQQVEDEYGAASEEIQASLEAAHSMTDRHFESYLKELRQSVGFWEAEIETTFAEWQDISAALQDVNWGKASVWEKLAKDVSQLLISLCICEMPATWWQGLGRQLPFFSTPQQRTDRVLVEVANRLLELDLQQHAHGFASPPRQELLVEVLKVVRLRQCLPAVAQHLLRNPDFKTLAELQVNGECRSVLSCAMDPDQKWALHIQQIFGAFLVDLALRGAVPYVAVQVGLLQAGCCNGWVDVCKAALAYTDEEHRTPLHVALASRNSSLAKQLLLAKADPSLRSPAGSSAVDIVRDKRLRALMSALAPPDSGLVADLGLFDEAVAMLPEPLQEEIFQALEKEPRQMQI
mmetsp:Transcript_60615/g.146481  ORF Transcript_60615/g.146481 Transcript_60615/m.146481 type:complete len:505 (-) Transcript_60615:165-1679(-)